MSNTNTNQAVKTSLETFFQGANFDDLNQILEESKRRFIHRGLKDNNYSLHLTSKSLGYKSISSTVLTLFELEESYLKSSHLQDFFEEDYKPDTSYSQSEEAIINHLSKSQNRTEFDNASDAIEKAFFENALNKYDGNFTLAAEGIDAGRKTVSRKVKKHNIEISSQPKNQIIEPTVDINEGSIALMGNAIASSAQNYPNLKSAYELVKREAMINAIQDRDYNVASASKSLGWTRATFRQNYTTLFDHEKFDVSKIDDDKSKLEDAIGNQKGNIRDTVSLFRRHIHSMPQMTALFESAKEHSIKTALANNDNNVTQTAKEIGLTRATISHHLKKYETQKSAHPAEKQEAKQTQSPQDAPKAKKITQSSIPNTKNAQPIHVEQPATRQTVTPTPASKPKELKRVNTASNKETPAPETRHNFESNDQVLKFLVDHFDYNELKELKAETTKALIATSMKENDFNIDQSANKLGLETRMMVNGLKNYFNIQITPETTPDKIERKLDKKVNSSKHRSTVMDILPGIESHQELSGLFAEAQKLSILKTWEENNKNPAMTADKLGISDDAVIKVLPPIELN